MLGNYLLTGESAEIPTINPEADYGAGTKALRLQICCVGEAFFMGRNDRCFCGSGKKKKRCHADMNEASLVAKLLELYAAVDERNSHAVSSPCRKGCASCCTNDFEVHFAEFLAVLDFLRIGHELNRRQRWAELIKNWNPKVKSVCFFLDLKDESCRIYAVRPLVCRDYGIT